MEYTVERSRRKTLSINITSDCRVVIKAPYYISDRAIREFAEKYSGWAEEKLIIRKKRMEFDNNIDAEKEKLLKSAKEVLPVMTERYAEMMGLFPSSVKITSAKTRFGSCSGRNAVCFSWRLMAYPKAAVEYVVVHELAHIKHHNHSREFYKLIEKYMPDYKERQKLLKKFADTEEMQ